MLLVGVADVCFTGEGLPTGAVVTDGGATLAEEESLRWVASPIDFREEEGN